MYLFFFEKFEINTFLTIYSLPPYLNPSTNFIFYLISSVITFKCYEEESVVKKITGPNS